MRVKKHAVWITLMLSTVSLMLAVVSCILSNIGNVWQFVTDVLISIFASSLVALMVFAYEYRAERNEVISGFCKTIESISFALDRVDWLCGQNGEEIDSNTVFNEDKEKLVRRICERYVKVLNEFDKLDGFFGRIDFFLDVSLLKRYRDRRLKYTNTKVKLTRKEKREAKEKSKARYWEEYLDTRKAFIQSNIYFPVRSMLLVIMEHAVNSFQLYLEGRKGIDKELIEHILELQKMRLEDETSGNKGRRNKLTYYLVKTLVGCNCFWIEMRKANKKTKKV